jgi:DNA polymerase-4
MNRKFIHIDMDAYYASVEQRDNPSIKGKPVVVGGTPQSRGVVSAASYEARKFGIKSAMAVKTAMNLCPNLIIIQPDFKKYMRISKELISIYEEYTDLVEPLSLDECYLDVTENKKNINTATEIAIELKKRIKKELDLTASVGVAPNKLLAKIASEINKPDGLFIIKPHQVDDFIKNLDVSRLWGVGRATYNKLKEMNINTCGELQKLSIVELVDNFGIFGETLYDFARGIDNREVETEHEVKSIGSEITFPYDTDDMTFIKKNLYEQLEIVIKRLMKYSIKAKTITVKIKYADFKKITRSRSISYFTDNINEVFKIASVLLKKSEIGRKKIRLIGISLSNFDSYKDKGQLELL